MKKLIFGCYQVLLQGQMRRGFIGHMIVTHSGHLEKLLELFYGFLLRPPEEYCEFNSKSLKFTWSYLSPTWNIKILRGKINDYISGSMLVGFLYSSI